mmetsp:Transcript_2026/g.5651  ORF Transcript_2026/g.5651 Transcript_2026/m.5651 type:complete len:253 (-) Transcript_2026:625-1383(-)
MPKTRRSAIASWPGGQVYFCPCRPSGGGKASGTCRGSRSKSSHRAHINATPGSLTIDSLRRRDMSCTATSIVLCSCVKTTTSDIKRVKSFDCASPRKDRKKRATALMAMGPGWSAMAWKTSPNCSVSMPKCLSFLDTVGLLSKRFTMSEEMVVRAAGMTSFGANSAANMAAMARSSWASAASQSSLSCGGRRTMSTTRPTRTFRMPKTMMKTYNGHAAAQNGCVAARGAASALQSEPEIARKSVSPVRSALP